MNVNQANATKMMEEQAQPLLTKRHPKYGEYESGWKPVPGYFGYRVNEYSQICGPKGKILKPNYSLQVHLCKAGTSIKKRIYQIALFSFFPHIKPSYMCEHIDGDSNNNNIDNLQWKVPITCMTQEQPPPPTKRVHPKYGEYETGWKPIPEFAGYHVNEHGQVRGKQGNILKPNYSWQVHLVRNGIGIKKRIYQIALLSFFPLITPSYMCEHIDGDSNNNNIDNLQWKVPITCMTQEQTTISTKRVHPKYGEYESGWKPVPGYFGYRVNEYSQICGPMGKILKPNYTWQVHLSKTGISIQKRIYQIALLSFFPLITPSYMCEHIDGDSNNNNIDNLQWKVPTTYITPEQTSIQTKRVHPKYGEYETGWKPVPGFPGYHVDEQSNVCGKNGNILKPNYLSQVHLCKAGMTIEKRVHQIALLSFFPTISPLDICDHIDKNYANNHIDNLQWLTRREFQQTRKRKRIN